MTAFSPDLKAATHLGDLGHPSIPLSAHTVLTRPTFTYVRQRRDTTCVIINVAMDICMHARCMCNDPDGERGSFIFPYPTRRKELRDNAKTCCIQNTDKDTQQTDRRDIRN